MSTAVARAQRISSTLIGTGICFRTPGQVPWLVAPDAFPLSSDERDGIERLGRDCYAFLETVHHAVIERDAIGIAIASTIGEHPIRASLMRSAIEMHPVPMVRPDMFWDADGRLTVVEIETMIGGLGMTTAIRQAYGENGFPGIDRAYASLIRATLPANDRPVVAFVNPASKEAYNHEFQVFAREVARRGIEMRIASPDEVTIDGDRVRVRGECIDLIHRFFRVSELARAYAPALEVMREIVERKLVPVLQPWKEMLEEKALFAFLHDPDWRRFWVDRLGEEAYTRLIDALPKSVVVTRESALCQSVLDSEPRTRSFWLKKSGETWGGHGAIDGKETSSGKWRVALLAAMSDAENGRGVWILQERRVCRQPVISYLDGLAVTSKPMNLRVSPFFFHEPGTNGVTLGDMLITARRSTKVHGATDAVVVPVSCA